VDLCSNCKVSVYLRALAVDHNYTETRSLRLILSERGICIVCLEILNLLKMRLLLYRPHDVESEGLKKSLGEVVRVPLLIGDYVRIGTTIVVLAEVDTIERSTSALMNTGSSLNLRSNEKRQEQHENTPDKEV
jgi:hypothetical protein